ncbi:hypothetical protein A3Q56_01761 [Intoshia linei]|uniref:Nuclear receptor domain-containing protein n=1 Tax=Intoshia linei TaxID=1819745 RepID=A0A177B9Z3_9BILA|nr:hypothetical protein A3Q56_01761 [Intoshia linei]
MITQKMCQICGDKANGYNFSAISCESCKAFFRRNHNKNIKGRCEGYCNITVESRSYCKKCRLSKCFSVGMKSRFSRAKSEKVTKKPKKSTKVTVKNSVNQLNNVYYPNFEIQKIVKNKENWEHEELNPFEVDSPPVNETSEKLNKNQLNNILKKIKRFDGGESKSIKAKPCKGEYHQYKIDICNTHWQGNHLCKSASSPDSVFDRKYEKFHIVSGEPICYITNVSASDVVIPHDPISTNIIRATLEAFGGIKQKLDADMPCMSSKYSHKKMYKLVDDNITKEKKKPTTNMISFSDLKDVKSFTTYVNKILSLDDSSLRILINSIGNIEGFAKIDINYKIPILKNVVSDLLLIRNSSLINDNIKSKLYHSIDCILNNPKHEQESHNSNFNYVRGGLFLKDILTVMKNIDRLVRNDIYIEILLIAIILFNTDNIDGLDHIYRCPTSCSKLCKFRNATNYPNPKCANFVLYSTNKNLINLQDIYSKSLTNYLRVYYNDGTLHMCRLINLISDIKTVSHRYKSILASLSSNDVEPLVGEMLDIQPK